MTPGPATERKAAADAALDHLDEILARIDLASVRTLDRFEQENPQHAADPPQR